jgi:hypothetical protein
MMATVDSFSFLDGILEVRMTFTLTPTHLFSLGFALLGFLRCVHRCGKNKSNVKMSKEKPKETDEGIDDKKKKIAMKELPDVWISRTGQRFHRTAACSNHGSKYEACLKCWPDCAK